MYMQDLQQWILSLVVSIVGGLGNGILLLAHYRRKPALQGKMKVAMHFMATMAAVDFSVCTIILPIEILTFANEYRNYPDIACKIFAFGRLMGLYASNFLLVAIAIDRFISVCFPFSLGITFQTAKYMTMICILGGVLVAAPNLYLFEVIASPDMKMQRCQMTEIPSLEIFRRVMTFTQLGIFIGSVITIVTLYSLVYRKVKQKEKKLRLMKEALPKRSNITMYNTCVVANDAITTAIPMKKLSNQKRSTITTCERLEVGLKPISNEDAITCSPENAVKNSSITGTKLSKEEKRLTKNESSCCSTSRNGSGDTGNNPASRTAFMLVLVTAVFVFSWLPYWIINLIAMTNHFHEASKTETLIALFFSSLFYINNAVNPIIYTFVSSSYRNDIKKHAFCSSGNSIRRY